MPEHTAKLVVHGLRRMTKKELRQIAVWMRKMADEIETCDVDDYSNTFTARLMRRQEL